MSIQIPETRGSDTTAPRPEPRFVVRVDARASDAPGSEVEHHKTSLARLCDIEASVVIPTRGRPEQLARCLSALSAQRTHRTFEVIVVDDNRQPALGPASVDVCPRARVVASGGVGPAMARNRGIGEAAGSIVLFTDDDTEPSPSWVEAACRYLEEQPAAVGVEGPIESPAFDPLYERSIQNQIPGAFWTCNIAYRRDALRRLGGFAEVFPHAHAEDLDLGFRALELGSIGFIPDMRMTHHPTTVSLADNIRRANYAASDFVLYKRHRARYASRVPLRLLPTVSRLRALRGMLRTERAALIGTPRRALRFVALGVGTTCVALWASLTSRAHVWSPAPPGPKA